VWQVASRPQGDTWLRVWDISADSPLFALCTLAEPRPSRRQECDREVSRGEWKGMGVCSRHPGGRAAWMAGMDGGTEGKRGECVAGSASNVVVGGFTESVLALAAALREAVDSDDRAHSLPPGPERCRPGESRALPLHSARGSRRGGSQQGGSQPG
jgi:hypothetical protein